MHPDGDLNDQPIRSRTPHAEHQAVTVLIDEYAGHLLDELALREKSVTHYVGVLRRMDRQIDAGLEGACTEDLRAWINAPNCRTGSRRSPKARRDYRDIAVGFYDWACDPRDPILDFNPARLLPKIKVPRGTRVRPATTPVVRDILARSTNPRRRWYLGAALEGMRCDELAELDRADVTEQDMLIHGKGGVRRTVPTHPVFWREVKDLPPGPVCTRLDGTAATGRYISARGNRYLHDKLGLPVHMHMLRKWFATKAWEASRDIFVVQELLGHANPNTTRLYIETNDGRKVTAVAGLPEVA